MADQLDDGFVAYDSKRDVMQFRFHLHNREPHIVTVTGECLDDHFGRTERTVNASRAAYLRNMSALQKLAAAKIERGEAPEIRTRDV